MYWQQTNVVIHERTKFDAEQKSLKFLLEIMTLVSSANNIECDTEFIHRGRSLICILNNRVSRIDPWETQCFIIPQSEKKC